MVSSESFLSSIETYPKELQKRLRRIRTGIFIPEEVLADIESNYRNWLSLNQISVKLDEKLDKRIFGTEAPMLSYLPEGQECFCGFLAPLKGSDEGATLLEGIPRSESSAISGANFLHPKDNWFSDHSNIKIRRSVTHGTFIDFKIRDTTFSIKESLIRNLSELLRSSARFSDEFPELQRSLRDVIFVVHKMLTDSRFVSPKKPLFVPEQVANQNANFLIYKNLVLVFTGDYTLCDFYELRGKNFKQKVLEEIKLLKGTSKSRVFEALEISSSKTGFYLRAKIKGKYLSIDTYAIVDLIDIVPYSNWMLSKVPSRFTVKDVFNAIGGALKYADWVNMSSLSMDSNSSVAPPKARFELKYIPWTFVVERKNTISKFVDGGMKRGGKNDRPVRRNTGRNERGKTGGKAKEKPLKKNTNPS